MAANPRSIEHFRRMVQMHSVAKTPSRAERFRIEAPNKAGPKSARQQQNLARRILEANTGSIVHAARDGMLCPVLQRDREMGYNFINDCGIVASDWNCGRKGVKARRYGLPPPRIHAFEELADNVRANGNRKSTPRFRVERKNGKDLDGIQINRPRTPPVKESSSVILHGTSARTRPFRKDAKKPRYRLSEILKY